jgi:hypothetical protein
MSKILVILLLLSTIGVPGLSAGSVRPEQRLITRILHALHPMGRPMQVYFEGRRPPDSLRDNPGIRLVSDPSDAQVIVADRYSGRLERFHKPILVLRYDLLKLYPSAVGAYFWQKGRPNIVMIRPRLRRAGIHLSGEFERYIESTLW